MRSKKAKKQPAEGESTPIFSDDKQAELVLTSLRDLAGEFFDHAIIITSRTMNGVTEFHSTKVGNEFAIKGMIEVYCENSSNEFSKGQGEE